MFGVIFLAELPDKTALAALLLATRHHPIVVFVGACLALTVQSAIAIAAGSLLARLPPSIVHVGSGALFIVCAVVMWVRRHDDSATTTTVEKDAGWLSALGTVFMVVFVAEWGDLTQIGTAGLQAKYHAALTIFAASTLALCCVAAIAVFVGNRAGRLLEPTVTQRVAAGVFAIIGVLLVAGVL